MRHYVYGLFRPDTGTLFYVGMGTGQRAWEHEQTRHRARWRGRSHKNNIIRKLIDDLGYPELPVVIFREGLTRQEAIDLEIALIYAIGRQPHGPLVNVTKGGEGWLSGGFSEEYLAEHREKVRRARGTPESRAKTKAQMLKQRENPEFQKNLQSSEVTEKRVAGIRASRQRPEVVAKMVEAAHTMWEQPRKWWTNGETQVRAVASPGDGWKRGRLPVTDEYRQTLSEAQLRRYSDPGQRKAASEAMVRGWVTRRSRQNTDQGE